MTDHGMSSAGLVKGAALLTVTGREIDLGMDFLPRRTIQAFGGAGGTHLPLPPAAVGDGHQFVRGHRLLTVWAFMDVLCTKRPAGQ